MPADFLLGWIDHVAMLDHFDFRSQLGRCG